MNQCENKLCIKLTISPSYNIYDVCLLVGLFCGVFNRQTLSAMLDIRLIPKDGI